MIFSWFILLVSRVCDIICVNTHRGSKSKTLEVTLHIRKPSRQQSTPFTFIGVKLNTSSIKLVVVVVRNGHDQAVTGLLRLTLGRLQMLRQKRW
jgi:hypothetical protein